MKMDEQTLEWLREQAREEGDSDLVTTVGRALDGDAEALAVCEQALRARVARAHREHRRWGMPVEVTVE